MTTLEDDDEDESDDPSSAEELVSGIRMEILKKVPKIRKGGKGRGRLGPRYHTETSESDELDMAPRVKNTTTLEYPKDNCVIKGMGLRRYQIIFDTFRYRIRVLR